MLRKKMAAYFMEQILNLKKLQNGSDIRGIALEGIPGENVNLGPAEAEALSLGFMIWLCEKTGKKCWELKISIGQDVRLSGDMLKASFIKAVTPFGVTVLDCGLASTPAMFMSTLFDEFRCDGAVMITASHLPFNRNGFKYFAADGGLNKEDIKAIISYGESAVWEEHPSCYGTCSGDHNHDDDAAHDTCSFSSEAAADCSGDCSCCTGCSNMADLDFDFFEDDANGEVIKTDLMERYAAHLRQLIIDGVAGENSSCGDADCNSDGNACHANADCNSDGCNAADESCSTNTCGGSVHNRSCGGGVLPQVLHGMHIVVDAGNGAGGFYATKVLAPLGADISGSCFLEPDGNFPNHAPNPEDKAAMASISQAVISAGADVGLIFDTDVDRSAAVDNTGREIARNGIVAMAAALISKQYPGSTVVTDSITSNQLTSFLTNNLGLCHLRYKRGYKNVINKGLELNASGTVCPLAIETSGHAAFKDNFFLDDGAYLATKIVIKAAQLHREGYDLSSVLADLTEPLEATEIRFPILCEDFSSYGDKVLEDLAAFTVKCGKEGSNAFGFSLVKPNYEGVRIDFDESCGKGWCLLRKSLHDPIMPLNIESDREGGVAVIKAILRDFLSQYDGLDISKL